MPDAGHDLMTIFAEALERTDPAARADYLDVACEDDIALRGRVEALLAAHDGAGRFLKGDPGGMYETTATEAQRGSRAFVTETSPASARATRGDGTDGTIATFAGTTPADSPGGYVAGQVIAGRYTLLEVLGEGGMGSVYRADQTQPVRRQVALKMIKIGRDSRAVLARFDAERQALALMDHPNIARVYDGGTTATGQPFFVMELVSGVPITSYCDRRRLSVRARLELFVSVCQAVQHAHQKGIIHRDLKPGNVLVSEVDGRPTPKVIDFGVAKATDFKLTDQSLGDTGVIVGTPMYMSPEQADPSSMDIDTRTDVYALGVVLYELLAGSPPIDAKQFKRGAILEMLRMVREVDPPRPSTKVSTAEALPSIAASRDLAPEHLKRALRGDLDWIVMKALEKDRGRRYETANGFAADISRHLAYEPVLAAPPSRGYRLRKFTGRHRGAVIAATLVVMALVGGIAGTTWGLFRAENRRVEAELARAAEAERVKERDAAFRVADARADDLKHRLGVSDMLLAGAAYDNRDVVLAAERLDNVPPDQRGWEWRYLKQQTRGGLFTLYGHSSGVSSASFSADGTRIVSASHDSTAKVWDARTGMPMLDLKGHTDGVSSASFSPDGTRIVSASLDGTAKVWDARTGTPLLELKGHSGPVACASFSADGTRIVTGSNDGTAKVWDARTGTPPLELKGHTGTVWIVWFSADGTRIVTGSDDGTAKVWDARTGTLRVDLKGHTRAVSSVWFSADGTRIVTGSFDNTAKVWDARSGTPLLELKGHTGPVSSASFSADGTRIVTASFDDSTAKEWDARTGTLLFDLKGHMGSAGLVWFGADGTRIVTGAGGMDQPAKVWDARTGEELKGEPIPPEPRPSKTSPDGRILAHAVGSHVELIPLQPDAEEMAYRLLLARPNFGRYREGYEAARAAADDFAAKFYLELLPPPERTRVRAETIVAPLFARSHLREDVLAALQAQPAAEPEIQAACLTLAETWPESAGGCSNGAWRLIRHPGQPQANYRRGLRLAETACRLAPDNGRFRNTLGVAQYRAGLNAEALATLMRSNELNKEKDPVDLAFLALVQHRLGQSEKARTALGRLREVMKNPQLAGSPEARAFLREAATIELDQLFPTDPFAP